MTTALRTLEHHEHAEHMAHAHAPEEHAEQPAHPAPESHGPNPAQWSALLVAFLAAGLALSEQGAKHAEIKVQQLAIDTADAWAQYQAKSIRSTVARDLAEVVATIDPPATDAAALARRDKVIAALQADEKTYDSDPKDGKDAIARRARDFEVERDHALEETHAYHNGSAAMELGIVLATASAITRSRPLILVAMGLGVLGVVLSVLGMFKPEYGAM